MECDSGMRARQEAGEAGVEQFFAEEDVTEGTWLIGVIISR